MGSELLDKGLTFYEVKTLIHIGAHEAQEVWVYDQYDFQKIYLVEPLPRCISIIKDKISTKPKYKLFDCALGSRDEKTDIYIADGEDSGSSSLLKPRDSKITFSNKIQINVKKFTSLGIDKVDAAVIDTQGFEIEVLKGFEDKIASLKFAIVEFANYEGYKMQPKYKDLNRFMKSKGFVVIDQIKRINQPIPTINAGSYGDALYVNKNLLNVRQIFFGNFNYYYRNNIIYDLLLFYKKKSKIFLKNILKLS